MGVNSLPKIVTRQRRGSVARERVFQWVSRLDGWVGGLDPAS